MEKDGHPPYWRSTYNFIATISLIIVVYTIAGFSIVFLNYWTLVKP